MAIDRIDWHWDSAEKIYRERHSVIGELTEEQQNQISLLAGNHIGLFLRWIIENHFEGDDADQMECEKVRCGEISGTEYLLNDCDGKFWDQDVTADIIPFVKSYYEGSDYLIDYTNCCLPDDVQCYDIITNDDDYFKLRTMIDKAFNAFKTHNSL